MRMVSKKLVSIVLALVLVMSAAAVSFAAEFEKPKLTN